MILRQHNAVYNLLTLVKSFYIKFLLLHYHL